ncbi:COG2335 Secreted and surface protein containing fasciclin-like repeats [Mycobacteriaceae bacterium]
MSPRTTLGVAAAIAAIAVAIPTAVQAYADPTPTPVEPAAPTASAAATPTKVPDPQGPGCDAYRKAVPTGAGSIPAMAGQTASQAIANNPDLSTFSAAISGTLNPEINIVSVLDGGPYIVFAPTDAAFAALEPATVETLKTDPRVLLPVLFYHMVLGNVGPANVAGTMPTQDGRSVVVTGKDGDIKVNGNRVSCAYAANGAYIYMIDGVLEPPVPAAEADASSTEATTTPATTAPATATEATTPEATTAESTSTPATNSPTTSAAPASESPSTSAPPPSTTVAPTVAPTTTATPAA